MRKLIAIRRWLILTVAALPTIQTTGCTLDSTVIQNAVTSQVVSLVNQLVAGLFDLALTRAFG